MRALFCFIYLGLLFSACNSDNVGTVCLPKSLRIGSDSIVYEYTSDRQLTALLSYRTWEKTVRTRVDLTYDNGRLTTATQSQVAGVTSPRVDLMSTIEYGVDGRPSKLTEIQPRAQTGVRYVTEFTHDGNGRLIKGVSTVEFPGTSEKVHLGGYIYEYNDDGNVTKVKYLVREPGTGNIVEVLARENLTFDDRSVFYESSRDLTTLNVYMYSHIPNVNNNLTSKIIYLSYNTHYNEPVEVTNTPTYDEKGRIKSSGTYSGVVSYFGSLNFSLATYECF